MKRTGDLGGERTTSANLAATGMPMGKESDYRSSYRESEQPPFSRNVKGSAETDPPRAKKQFVDTPEISMPTDF